ncbi:MAG: hypothetical protein ACYCOR_10705 [Acidobacteriaceae bacterium]
MTNAEANRIIAEWVGDEGFQIVGVPQPPGSRRGTLQRGEPLDYCSSLDLTVAAMPKEDHLHIDLAVDWRGRWLARTYNLGWIGEPDPSYYPDYVLRKAPAEALAHALAEAIVAMGEKGARANER